tara:strand:- start:116 stop:997 length:882 start_codon:yes stop_codon:yes gene_type:complete
MPNSYVEYTGAGTGANQLGQSTFSYSDIDVLNSNDINAFGETSGGSRVSLTISSRDATAKTITLSTAPSIYAKLRVFRQTTSNSLVDFVDGARLTESDLDTAYKQGLFVAQEVSEDAGGVGTTSTNNLSLTGTTTVDNLTATGTVSLPNISISNDNLAGGIASSKLAGGIDITSQINGYEEGNWTPGLSALGTSGSTITNAKYTKIGRVVHIYVDIDFVSNSDTSPVQIAGLPYSGNNNMNQTLPTPFSTNYTGSTLIPLIQDTVIFLRHTGDATYQDVSGKFLRISGSYQIL